MSTAARKARCTPEEYLVRERRAEFRHEYRDGLVTERAVSNVFHSRVVTNLACDLWGQLRDGPSEVYPVGMRVGVDLAAFYAYPDLSIVRERPRFLDDQSDTLLNPTVLVEVFSPATEADDRGDRFERYKRLDSLREYVLAAQDRVRVERYERRGHDWVLTEYDRLDDTLRLESIGCKVPLGRIYNKMELPNRGWPVGA